MSKLALAATYALAGNKVEARRTLVEAEAIPDPTYHGNVLLIICHIGLGDLDKAVELIEDEYARGGDWLGEIAYNPLYAPVRNDLRVESILRKVGVTL